jgi:kynureninase
MNSAFITLENCTELDKTDPLAHCKARFQLPEGVIYLDGNSLGAMPKSVPPRMTRAIEQEWAVGLIRSWNDADWYPAPQRVGAKIAALVGAQAHEVIVCDSISVNLFKVLVSALRLRPGRHKILGELGNFPTDAYIASGVAELMKAEFVALDTSIVSDAIFEALDESVAILSLTHVNYKSGRRYDMAAITKRAHEVGALVVWDLAHTAGAMPCELNACKADFAVGCGYKYLNGGPGAPAFVFVAERHHAALNQPLKGWHGHAQPFAFVDGYVAGKGMDQMLVGTASQLGLIALEAALEVFEGVDMHVLRRKSEALSELFIRLVDQELNAFSFGLATPRDASQRGSQVALTHPEAYAIMQAVIARGVIGDFRAPDILRFGFASLYVSFTDIWHTIAHLKAVMATNEWQAPQFMQRKAVT